MLSKNKVKFIKNLHSLKGRKEHAQFVIEGDKMVRECMQSACKIHLLAARQSFIIENKKLISSSQIIEVVEVSENEMHLASSLKTPNQAIAVVSIPNHTFSISMLQNKFSLLLEDIQDPGNLGTILRIAAWFGFDYVLCSPHCADAYSPKVVQASMSAIWKVPVVQVSPLQVVTETRVKTYAATLNGKSIYETGRVSEAVIILGNESQGISEDILKLAKEKITIPPFYKQNKAIDSLNVAIASAIICSEFKRM